MPILIPVQLDKSTGRLYAKAVSGSGASAVTGFVHTQSVAASSWNIAHALGTENAIVQIYDATSELIVPDTIVIVDENNILVTFGAAQAGVAVLMAFTS